jgi:hypothetical protein
MAKRVIILGTGGNCVDILDTINSINETAVTPQYTCLGFLDDNPQEWGRVIHGAPILGPLEKAGEYDDCYFVNGIGSAANFWRKPEIIARVNVPPERFCTLIHPTASVSKMAKDWTRRGCFSKCRQSPPDVTLLATMLSYLTQQHNQP